MDLIIKVAKVDPHKSLHNGCSGKEGGEAISSLDDTLHSPRYLSKGSTTEMLGNISAMSRDYKQSVQEVALSHLMNSNTRFPFFKYNNFVA